MSLTTQDFTREALSTLEEYTKIACLSPEFDSEWEAHGHLERALQLLVTWVRQRKLASFNVEVNRLSGRTPMLVVTVEATTTTNSSTTLLYGHFDKQPPLGEWSAGLSPFTPVRRGNRLYGRGVADDGYSTFSALLALEALEREGRPHGRCVVLIEASEESGSPDLNAHLDALSAHLGEVDLMICLDSGALTYDRLWVTTSLRGVVNLNLRVDVLERGVHSGSASGVVPSSFRILRLLLDRLEDAHSGRVLLDELWAEIPAHHHHAAQATAQEFGDVTVKELPLTPGLTPMGTDAADRILWRTWHPTLSVTGMGGIPLPSEAGNVLRPYTTAALSFRLPPTVDANIARDAIERALTHDVPHHAKVQVTFQEPATGWVAPPSAPWLDDALERASRENFGQSPGYTGEGGTIPFLGSLQQLFPNVLFVATGVLGPDSNAHGIDEMLDLEVVAKVTNAVATILEAHAQR